MFGHNQTSVIAFHKIFALYKQFNCFRSGYKQKGHNTNGQKKSSFFFNFLIGEWL